MVWARLDDGILDNLKIVSVGMAGFAYHVAGIVWSSRALTDGVVPAVKARTLFADVPSDYADSVLALLVDAGLWTRSGSNFQIRNFLEYQFSRRQVLQHREELSRKRSEAGKKGGRPPKSKAESKAESKRVTLSYPILSGSEISDLALGDLSESGTSLRTGGSGGMVPCTELGAVSGDVVTGELPSPAAPAPNGSDHVRRTESQPPALLSPAPVAGVDADCGTVDGSRNAFRSEDGQVVVQTTARPSEGNVVGFASEAAPVDASRGDEAGPASSLRDATNHSAVPNSSAASSGIVGEVPQSRLSLSSEAAMLKKPARTRESTQGTRLDPSWTPEPEPALESGVDVQGELAKYRDYWAAVAGQRGRKLDWQATWRTWLRNAAEFRGRAAPRKAAQVRQPASDGWAKGYEFKNLFED